MVLRYFEQQHILCNQATILIKNLFNVYIHAWNLDMVTNDVSLMIIHMYARVTQSQMAVPETG